jgi:Bacterial Ig domain/PKD domain
LTLKPTWLVEGLKLDKMAPILLGALLLFTVIFLPGLSHDRLPFAQAATDVGKLNSVSVLANDPLSGLASPSAAFISSDSNTCALDDPSTFLHIECTSSLPILFPSLSQISTTKKSVSLQNNDTLLANADNFTQDSEVFDPNLVNTSESSLDNTTLPGIDYGGGSSSGSFDISSIGGDSSSDNFSFDSSSDSNSRDIASNNSPKAKSQSVIVDENTTKSIKLSASDKDGELLAFTNLSKPRHGLLEDSVPPDVTYKPDPGFSGSDAFSFKAYDGVDFSKIATISIEVNKAPVPIIHQNSTTSNPENQVPITEAGPDQTVSETQTVNLDGSKSSDPDGDKLSYNWKQTGGDVKINMDSSDGVAASFVAPVTEKEEQVKIELTVDDSKGGKSSDTVNITIKKANQEPVSDAGSDQTADAKAEVKLDGSKSTDPDGNNLKFEWSQTKGSDVKLSDKHDTSPSFVAPEVDKETEMQFELLVDDGNGGTSKDVVKITVQPYITTTDAPGDNKVDSTSKDSKNKDGNKEAAIKNDVTAVATEGNDGKSESNTKDSTSKSDSKDDSSSSKDDSSSSKDDSSSSKDDSSSSKDDSMTA